MPTFSPPLVEENLRTEDDGDPSANRLFSYYKPQRTGLTVWKDQADEWHSQLYPNSGGDIHTSYYNGKVTSVSDPGVGIDTAKEVYHGGHEYPVTDAKADELRAAGFFVGGHWDAEETNWINYALTSEINKAFKGGDGCASVANADGSSAWVFADNLIGTITAEGIYIFALPTRNAVLTRSAAGVLGQVYPEGSHPAWSHPNPLNWWWCIDVINDGLGFDGTRYVSCWEVTSGGSFGEPISNNLLQLNAFLGRTATIDLPTPTRIFYIQSIYKDDVAGYHYIHGNEWFPPDFHTLETHTHARLARCPIGQLATLSTSIEYWDGTTWTASQTSAPRIKAVDGREIEGNVDVTKVGSDYILISVGIKKHYMTVYKSPTITGPWQEYHQLYIHKPPIAGALAHPPVVYGYYLPKFHEWMSPTPTHLVATVNRNVFTTHAGKGIASNTLHVSNFTPKFLYVPTPDVA